MSDTLQVLSAFIAETTYEHFSPELTEKAKRHFLDTLGAGLAGTDSHIWRQCRELIRQEGGNACATLWGEVDVVTPRQAAWLNGVASHMYELDDCGGCDHSGAVVIPALLAALPLASDPVSGKDFIKAMVVGYDVGRRVLEACGGYEPHNGAGWHSTATCGVFGAAAAVCSLLRMPTAKCASALGIAASFSGGIWAFIHDGSHTKKLHCGRAAEGGLQAAMLADKGILGPTSVFEDVWGGFLKTIASESLRPSALTDNLGSNWKLSRCSIKPYASCRGAHSAVDALSELLKEHSSDGVAEVRVSMSAFLFGMCGGKDVAQLPAAQMSLPYALVALIVYRDAGLASYSDERRLHPDVQKAMDRVILEVDENQSDDDEPVVYLRTNTGDVWQNRITVPSGSPHNFLSDEQLWHKFKSVSEKNLSASQIDNIISLCMGLEKVPDMTNVTNMLKGKVSQPGKLISL